VRTWSGSIARGRFGSADAQGQTRRIEAPRRQGVGLMPDAIGVVVGGRIRRPLAPGAEDHARRLAGASLDSAKAELARIARVRASDHPDTKRRLEVRRRTGARAPRRWSPTRPTKGTDRTDGGLAAVPMLPLHTPPGPAEGLSCSAGRRPRRGQRRRGNPDANEVELALRCSHGCSPGELLMKLLLLIALLFIAASSSAEDKVIRLASLDWPPYTGSGLHEGGTATVTVRKAVEKQGFKLEVSFLPWEEAVQATRDGKFDGYFPEYYSKDVLKEFDLSRPIGTGPLGLVENVASPISWNAVEDLAAYTVGVVSGYVNTARFDQLVAEGKIKTEAVGTDLENALKVADGKIPVAVIDSLVLDYLVRTEAALKGKGDKLKMNAKLLEDKKLHVVFARTPSGTEARKVINTGLAGSE
jgi:polar amino acid transport system substrate-binding protein